MDERTSRRGRSADVIGDPRPVSNISRMWAAAGRAATIGIFILALGAFLYIAEPLLMPVLGAAVIATMLSPLVKRAKTLGVPPWATAILVVVVFGVLAGAAASMMAGPVNQWIGRAPEIGAKIARALSVVTERLSSLRSLFGAGAETNLASSAPNMIMPVLAFATPAVAELLLFFGALIFILASQIEIHKSIAMLFASRDAKLRALRVMRDIENNLARYLTVVTAINFVLGAIVALGCWIVGLPNPMIFGMLAAILNYLPYIGPGVTVVVLFGVGLVSFESIARALIAPVFVVALCTLEGHFITPTIVGRRLTLNPLVVFLGLAFWSWLWGPIGAFFAAPLTIVFLVVYHHVFAEDGTLPLG